MVDTTADSECYGDTHLNIKQNAVPEKVVCACSRELPKAIKIP